MRKHCLSLQLALLVSALGWTTESAFCQTSESPLATSAPQQGESPFLRIRFDKDGKPASLQTSIVRYRNSDKTKLVDLIGAVHIGDQQYYRVLNRQFEQYDAVLYELVAEKGTRVPAGGSESQPDNPIAMIQSVAKDFLGLHSQLSEIDYQPENFVHADLSPAELQTKMAERGDTALTLGLESLTEMMRKSQLADNQEDESMNLETLLDSIANPGKLKVMMAQQFADSGSADIGLGPGLNKLIIEDRNKAAIAELQKQFGKQQSKLAIFYGAAHLPDFDKRLKDLGFDRSESVWVDAWDLTVKESENTEEKSIKQLFKLLENLIDDPSTK